MDGGINIRFIDSDPQSILNDFSSNINIIYNGEEKSQNQLLNELYYKNFNDYNKNSVPSISSNPLLKKREIPEGQKPLEPGQVDPATFFGSSLKGIF